MKMVEHFDVGRGQRLDREVAVRHIDTSTRLHGASDNNLAGDVVARYLLHEEFLLAVLKHDDRPLLHFRGELGVIDGHALLVADNDVGGKHERLACNKRYGRCFEFARSNFWPCQIKKNSNLLAGLLCGSANGRDSAFVLGGVPVTGIQARHVHAGQHHFFKDRLGFGRRTDGTYDFGEFHRTPIIAELKKLWYLHTIMEIKYLDIHSHLNLSPLSENREAVLAKMREEGVGTITVGTGLATSKMAVEVAEANPDICWATVGIHPCHTCGDEADPLLMEEGAGGGGWEELEFLAKHPKVVAIGETGLDYFHEDTPESRKVQENIFRKHIDLAISVRKPLMLHVRASKGSDNAYYDALKILGEYSLGLRPLPLKGGDAPSGPGANFHFFGGSKECMEAIIAAGFTISVDGPITFSSDYDEMIVAVPLDKVMIETDAPFAAPKPYRGKPCEPWMVVEVAKKIAELKNLPEEEVREQLFKNAKDFFGINF